MDTKQISIENTLRETKQLLASKRTKQKAISNFKTGDDMMALNTLYSLSSELSMANDTLADDINCQSLIAELVKLFDKFFLPDISLFSLQCINYLLDINPAYTSTLHKFGGIPKIVLMTQNIEFIDLAENAIKAIEKMSVENSFALLECDAFASVLNLIDFFDSRFKKSAVKACINMTMCVTTYELFSKYVIPAIPALSSLTKMNENDITLTSSAIMCFMYLISNIKAYQLHKNSNGALVGKTEDLIIQNGMLENVYEIVIFYLNNPNDNKIPGDLFKNILKIFQSLCSISNEATNLLLNMNILEIIYNLLKNELGSNNNFESNEITNSNVGINININIPDISSSSNNSNNNLKNRTSYMNEIFPLLMGFFPTNFKIDMDMNSENELDDKNIDKIMSPSNKFFYVYFADKIIKLLVTNIMNISSCSTLIQVVKLLIVFSKFSSEDQITQYIEADKISHIISKLLDTKEAFYLQDVLILIEIMIQKVPQVYIISFLREGIIENLKNFKIEIPEKKKYNSYAKNILVDPHAGATPILYNQVDQNIQPPKEGIKATHENKIIENNNNNNLTEEEYEEEEDSIVDNMYESNNNNNNNEEEHDNSCYEEEDYLPEEEADYNKKLKKAIEISHSFKDAIETLNELQEEEGIGQKSEQIDINSIVNNHNHNYNNNIFPASIIPNSNLNKEEDDIVMLDKSEEIFYSEYLKQKEKVLQKLTEHQKNYDNSITGTDDTKPIINSTYVNSNKLESIKIDQADKINFTQPKKTIISNDILTHPEISASIYLKDKLKQFNEKYLNNEKIEEYMSKANEKENPMEILKKLEGLKIQILEELNITNGNNFEKLSALIKNVVDILISQDKQLTLWEIEKSEIFLVLAQFLDFNFIDNYKNIKELSLEVPTNSYSKSSNSNKSSSSAKKYLSLTDNFKDTVKRLKVFFSCFDNNTNKILNLVKVLQYTITSMNCFVVYYNEASDNLYKYNPYRTTYKEEKKSKLKLKYSNENANRMLESFKESKVEYDKIVKINETFSKTKEYLIYIASSETFSDVEKVLIEDKKEFDALFVSELNNMLNLNMKNTNQIKEENGAKHLDKDSYINNTTTSILNNTESNVRMNLNFYLEFDLKGIKQNFAISKHWNTLMLSDELQKIFTKEELKNLLYDLPIYFSLRVEKIGLEDSFNQEPVFGTENEINKKVDLNINKNKNNQSEELLESYKLGKIFNDLNFNNSFLDLDEGHDKINSNSNSTLTYNLFEQKLFLKYYIEGIISNPHLYEIKRLAPSLFLLSLLNLCLQNFSSFFNLKAKIGSEQQIMSNNKDLITFLFENAKVSNLLLKQVRDISSISFGSIPSWCKNLTSSYSFMSNFNARYLLFKTCSFDPRRGTINLYNYLKNFLGEKINEQSMNTNISKNRRFKIVVERNEILFYAFKIMKENSNYNGYLEFEYLNETGTGLGPTLEFYSLVIEKVKENKSLWYRTTDSSLFPAPINDMTKVYEENKKMFTLLGFIIARALYDDRLVDIPLNSLFWDLVLSKPINFKAISQIDSNLGDIVIRDFLQIITQKNTFLKNNPNYLQNDNNFSNFNINEENDLGEVIKYNNTRVDEVGILFNLPGYPDIELKEDGLEHLLTVHNIEEYVVSIFDKLFGNGILPLVNAFKSGFNLVFNVDSLKCFESKEIEETLCGSTDDKWEFDVLYENVKPDHGYDKNSATYRNLLNFMVELKSKDKKKFLLFVTGSPRLPIGGFKNLSPKLTVVKKSANNNSESPDDYLPTVMTCQNYLKVPEYSNYEIFKSRVFIAINEGSNAFHLS